MNYSKVKISGKIRLKSGLHIGTSNAFAAIGAVNNPIIRDPSSNLPMIPGSSIKGKMRSLLARTKYNEKDSKNLKDDGIKISRLFGNSNIENCKIGRLIFRDAFLDKEAFDKKGLPTYTEIKFENTIDRITAEATPRQVERAVRDSEFTFEIIYDISEEWQEDVEEDMEILREGFKLLEWDYLGGSGSRGYGKIAFESLKVQTVIGDYTDSRVLERILKSEKADEF